MKCRQYILICLCTALLGAAAWGQVDIPDAVYRRALKKIELARNKQLQNDFSNARGIYRQAERDLRVLQKRYPDFKPAEIAAQIAACRQKLATLEEDSQKLPEGCIHIRPRMSRGGTRYTKGQMLARQVKEVGDDEYEVEGYTVRVTSAGGKIGVSCTGPDFQYRQLKQGKPCKHIWAVIIKEGLLEGTGKK